MVFGVWRMQICDGTFASWHILFYFILFTAFIHLFTLRSLKGADKRVPSPSPSPSAVTAPLGWASVGQGRFYCPSILFYSIVGAVLFLYLSSLPSLNLTSNSGIYFWWHSNNLIMTKTCTFSIGIRFVLTWMGLLEHVATCSCQHFNSTQILWREMAQIWQLPQLQMPGDTVTAKRVTTASQTSFRLVKRRKICA